MNDRSVQPCLGGGRSAWTGGPGRLRKGIAGVAALIAALGVALGAATAALACGFHNYAPQPTLVDRLLDSDRVVLARPASDNRFRYAGTKAVIGELEGVDIPHLVDTATLRRLEADPDAAILFAFDPATDAWQRLVYVDDAMWDVLDRIVQRLTDWDAGAAGDRLAFFAGMLDHPDERIHRLALRELDLADYASLSALAIVPDRSRLSDRLYAPADWDLRYIRVLLLGFDGDPGFAPFFERGIRTSLLATDGMLGAFASAYVEHSGAVALTDLTQNFLLDGTLPIAQKESLIEALAIHSESGPQDLGAEIRASLADILERRPELAAAIARQFGARSDWSMHADLFDVLKHGDLRSTADLLEVAQYVSLAVQSRKSQ